MNEPVNTPTHPLMLTSEVARLLEVSAQTVHNWERRGILTAVTTERGVRLFYRDVVERVARERAHLK